MGTAVATFEDRPALSPTLSKFFQENKNIQDKDTVPSLSIEGSKWAVVLNGEKTVLTKTDSDGDRVPVTTFKVIVLDQSPQRGRAYYGEDAYDPKKTKMPECWSDDCVTPSKNVAKPQCANCAACPKSAKGSGKKVGEKETVACSQYQMIAVVPASDFSFEPLRLKLSITSIWDGQNKENDAAGWFAFKNYTDYLRAHGVDHTALVVTKMKFDSTAGISYPKILFSRDKFLTEEQLNVLVPVIQSDKVKQLISASWTPNGRDGTHVSELTGPEAMIAEKAAQAAKDVTPKGPTPEEVATKAAAEAAAKAEADKAAKKAAKKAAAEEAARVAAEAAAAAAKAATDEDEDEDVALPGTAAAAPTQAASGAKAGATQAKETPAASSAAGKPATAAAAGAPAGLSDLLSKWGDD